MSSKLSSDLTISSGYNILLGDAGVNVTGQRVTLEAHSHALRLATSGTVSHNHSNHNSCVIVLTLKCLGMLQLLIDLII